MTLTPYEASARQADQGLGHPDGAIRPRRSHGAGRPALVQFYLVLGEMCVDPISQDLADVNAAGASSIAFGRRSFRGSARPLGAWAQTPGSVRCRRLVLYGPELLCVPRLFPVGEVLHCYAMT